MASISNFETLPPEVVALVFKKASCADLRCINAVCKRWNAIIAGDRELNWRLSYPRFGEIEWAKRGVRVVEPPPRLDLDESHKTAYKLLLIPEGMTLSRIREIFKLNFIGDAPTEEAEIKEKSYWLLWSKKFPISTKKLTYTEQKKQLSKQGFTHPEPVEAVIGAVVASGKKMMTRCKAKGFHTFVVGGLQPDGLYVFETLRDRRDHYGVCPVLRLKDKI